MQYLPYIKYANSINFYLQYTAIGREAKKVNFI